MTVVIAGSMLYGKATDAEIQLVKSVIPGSKIEAVDKTPVDGLYIVMLKNKKFLYVYPYKKLIFFGELITSDGKNLSTFLKKKISRRAAGEVSAVPEGEIGQMMEASLKVEYNGGNDKYALFIFTDPDCPFCRMLEKYISKRGADARFLFTPIRRLHPEAERKSLQMISNPDRIREALHSIRSEKPLKLKIKDGSKERLAQMERAAAGMRLDSTPVTFVYDKSSKRIVEIIRGADTKQLEKFTKEIK